MSDDLYMQLGREVKFIGNSGDKPFIEVASFSLQTSLDAETLCDLLNSLITSLAKSHLDARALGDLLNRPTNSLAKSCEVCGEIFNTCSSCDDNRPKG